MKSVYLLGEGIGTPEVHTPKRHTWGSHNSCDRGGPAEDNNGEPIPHVSENWGYLSLTCSDQGPLPSTAHVTTMSKYRLRMLTAPRWSPVPCWSWGFSWLLFVNAYANHLNTGNIFSYSSPLLHTSCVFILLRSHSPTAITSY